MLPLGEYQTRRFAWCAASVLLTCGVGIRPTLAQPPAAQTPPAAPAAPAAAAPTTPGQIDLHAPLPHDAMAAFNAVESWVRAVEVPKDPTLFPATRSAYIVLRLDNRVIGRGVSLREDGAGVWEAAGLAIAEAIQRIPTSNDATASDMRRDAAARITISLELGGRLIPLRANGWNQIDAEVNVAMDAVAAKLTVNEEELIAATFPSVMRARGDAPSSGVARAVAEASGDPLLALPSDARSTPRSMREQHGVRLYHCRVTHLAQTAPGVAPTFLYRGSRLIQGSEITRDAIDRWSTNLATHVSRRYDILSYNPVAETGPISPRAPMAPELAITIRALEQRLARPGMSDDAREEASQAIAAMRNRLREQFPKDRAISAINAAAMVLAGVAGAADPAIQLRVDDALDAAVTNDGTWSPTVAPASRAFIAWALVERAEALDGDARQNALTRADRAVRSIYRDTPEGDLVGQMPWLFFAERTLAQGADTIPAAATLRNVRDLIIRHQLTSSDAGDEGLDLIGGVVYTRQGAALPNAQSARAITFLCGAMSDPRITNSDESLRQLTHALAGIRFLRQLTMDEASGHIAIDPHIALGGVQAAAWDPGQPIEASALSLLAAREILTGLDALAAAATNAAPPTPPAP